MAEKPILFSTPMVRAILDGRKTMTRRICKDANDYCEPLNSFIDNEKRTYAVQNYGDLAHTDYVSQCEVRMPICVGDRLWVRETWADLRGMGFGNDPYTDNPFNFAYKADIKPGSDSDRARIDYGVKWRPSIHMPKAAARIWLEVVSVKVERLQEISDEDRLKEGIRVTAPKAEDLLNDYKTAEMGKHAFIDLWDSINVKSGYDWDANPWVWVIEFDREQRP